MAYSDNQKKAYTRQRDEIKQALKERKLKYYGVILSQNNPGINPMMVYNAMNANVYNWEMLKMVGDLVNYPVSQPCTCEVA